MSKENLPEPVKSGFIVPFVDKYKAIVMLEMLHIAYDGLSNPVARMLGNTITPEFEKEMLGIIQEMSDKFHEQGWCEDKNCRHFKQKPEDGDEFKTF